jgi:hypothetical protein
METPIIIEIALYNIFCFRNLNWLFTERSSDVLDIFQRFVYLTRMLVSLVTGLVVSITYFCGVMQKRF